MAILPDDNYRGFITDCSKPIDGIKIGMAFAFEGSVLSVYDGKPLSQSEQASMAFNAFWKREKVNAFFTCRLLSLGQSAVFHASGTIGVHGCELRFPIVDYWILSNDKKLEDVNEIAFAGPSVDSFCPMTYVELGNDLSLRIPALGETKIECGACAVGGIGVSFSTFCGWKGKISEGIEFESVLVASPDCSIDYEFLKDLYIAVCGALRFCLGRGNVSLDVRLRERDGKRFSTIGKFVACHGRMFVPDGRDGLEGCFVRSRDIGESFSQIIGFFDSEGCESPALDRDRDDASIITYSKVIDLCAAFEEEFECVFEGKVEHSSSTERRYEKVRAALLELAEGLSSDEKRIVKRLAGHVQDDNLQARIDHTLKKMPDSVVVACKKQLEISEKGVGKKLMDVRNAAAHGLTSKVNLADARAEYLLVKCLVFAMRLKRMGLAEESIARLVRCMA